MSINRTHASSASGASTATPSFPATVNAGDNAFLSIQLKQASGGSASPVAPEGWVLQAAGAGGSGSPGAGSGQIAAAKYKKICDGTEGGTTAQASATAAINCISAYLILYRADSGEMETESVAGSDSTPGASWSAAMAEELDIEAGDTVFVVSCTNHNTGPNRSAHNYQPAGLALVSATEFSDGGWSPGTGLGGCAVQFDVAETTTDVYTNTATMTSANAPCGVSIATRLREIV
jgi:hypothetical protein